MPSQNDPQRNVIVAEAPRQSTVFTLSCSPPLMKHFAMIMNAAAWWCCACVGIAVFIPAAALTKSGLVAAFIALVMGAYRGLPRAIGLSLAAMVLWGVLSWLVAETENGWQFPYPDLLILQFITLPIGMLMASRPWLWTTFIVAMMAGFAIGFIQAAWLFFTGNSLFLCANDISPGFEGRLLYGLNYNHIDFGAALVVCALIILYASRFASCRWRWVLVALCALSAVGACLSGSRIATLGIAAGIFVSLLFQGKPTLPRGLIASAAAIALLAIGAFSFLNRPGSMRPGTIVKHATTINAAPWTSRLDIWRLSGEIVTAHPWVGIGRATYTGREWRARADSYRIDGHSIANTRDGEGCAHNDFLHMMSVKGIPFALAVLAIFCAIGFAVRRQLRLQISEDHGSIVAALLLSGVILGLVSNPVGTNIWWPAAMLAIGHWLVTGGAGPASAVHSTFVAPPHNPAA